MRAGSAACREYPCGHWVRGGSEDVCPTCERLQLEEDAAEDARNAAERFADSGEAWRGVVWSANEAGGAVVLASFGGPELPEQPETLAEAVAELRALAELLGVKL